MSLKAHDTSACHQFAMQAWAEFKLQKVRGATIYRAIDDEHAKTVAENRQYIRAVVDASIQHVKMLPREGTEKGLNPTMEATLELLKMLAKYDDTVEKRVDGPRNAKYTHHDIQNELSL